MKKPRSKYLSIYFTIAWVVTVIFGVSWTSMATTSTVQIQIDQQPPFFSPSLVTAVNGSVIQWVNRTGELHNIRADDCIRRGPCSFESRMIEPGRSFTVTDLRPGEYAYHCGIHPFMRGFLTVRGKSPSFRSTDI